MMIKTVVITCYLIIHKLSCEDIIHSVFHIYVPDFYACCYNKK